MSHSLQQISLDIRTALPNSRVLFHLLITDARDGHWFPYGDTKHPEKLDLSPFSPSVKAAGPTTQVLIDAL